MQRMLVKKVGRRTTEEDAIEQGSGLGGFVWGKEKGLTGVVRLPFS